LVKLRCVIGGPWRGGESRSDTSALVLIKGLTFGQITTTSHWPRPVFLVQKVLKTRALVLMDMWGRGVVVIIIHSSKDWDRRP